MKLLITLLTSYNEFILYESYNSIKNQIKHNIDYDIFIVVNSKNDNYYYDVCKVLNNEKIKIVRTESNGRPGMGHNSLINIFKNNYKYDYLLTVDGDDFLYPYALHQLEKIMIYNPDVIVGSNEDIISNFREIYDKSNCNELEFKYFSKLEPNIYINKQFELYKKATPFRLCMISKNIFKYNIDKFYCEECEVFDDYLLFLHVLNLYYTSSLNIYHINLKNIYIYYKAHISSVCYQNSSDNKDNIEILIDKFDFLKSLDSKVKLKIPSLYISNYTLEKINYSINEENMINYNYNEFLKSEQYKLNYEYLKKISRLLYDSSIKYIRKEIICINNMNFDSKKKIYLLLENFIINDYFDEELLKYFLLICNNLNYIATDIIDKILNNFDLNNILKEDYIEYYENGDYISCYLLIRNNKNYDFRICHYYYLVCNKLNIKLYDLLDNEIFLDEKKKTIILVDAMDIEYDIFTIYEKGLGGTQICYINLATILSKNYNVILMNKNKNNKILKLNNIHLISYNNIDSMCVYINNINADFIIYNFIKYGQILKDKLNYSNLNNKIFKNKTSKNFILKNYESEIELKPKLWMYEHITINSHYKSKLETNYNDYYDRIVFVSRYQLYEYSKNLKIDNNKTLMLYNRLSPIFYFNKLEKNILEQKELSIIYCSNPQRGLENFIEIFPLLRNKYKNLKLKIFSSLEMYNLDDNDYLNKLYKVFDNMDGVEINKCISQLQLKEELNKSLLFIYPTFITETFCNSCVEAASCGCNIISTNIGALKEVLEDYGNLIDVNIENLDHPYYDIIDKNYINKLIKITSTIIDKYLNKCNNLENKLENQIRFIKKKYSYKFYENLF